MHIMFIKKLPYLSNELKTRILPKKTKFMQFRQNRTKSQKIKQNLKKWNKHLKKKKSFLRYVLPKFCYLILISTYTTPSLKTKQRGPLTYPITLNPT